jgi:hypothetical protein
VAVTGQSLLAASGHILVAAHIGAQNVAPERHPGSPISAHISAHMRSRSLDARNAVLRSVRPPSYASFCAALGRAPQAPNGQSVRVAGAGRAELAEMPETRFAEASDGTCVAYQVSGAGPVDLVLAIASGVPVEDQMEDRHCADFIRRLSSFARVIRFDRHGIGMSDPLNGSNTSTWSRGPGFVFHDRREHELKGISHTWQLFTVDASGDGTSAP